MKKGFWMLLSVVAMFAITSCCSKCEQKAECTASCEQQEVSECVKKRAKCCATKMTEMLELSEEQAAAVETLLIERISKERCAKKTFEAELEQLLGAEKYAIYKEHAPCHKKHGCCEKKGQCGKEKPCCSEKSDSCKQQCSKPCAEKSGEGCGAKCGK